MSIGGLRVVYISSIVNEVIETISFFFARNFCNTKTRHKQKPASKTKASKQKTTKATILCTQKLYKREEIIYFAVFLFKISCKKIEILSITSFTILLSYPLKAKRLWYHSVSLLKPFLFIPNSTLGPTLHVSSSVAHYRKGNCISCHYLLK